METSVLVTVLLFLAGLVFQSGRLLNRVDHLDQWRRDVDDDLKAIRSTVDRIAAVVDRKRTPLP